MGHKCEQAYHDERKKLIDGEHDYAKSYDRYVMTLSGGALALSVTFLHDIVGDGPIRASYALVGAWGSFTLSVTAALVSIHQSAPLFRDFRDILDRKAEHAGDKFSWEEVRNGQMKCRRLRRMDWLNLGSLVMFLSGVILLLSFTGLNLTGAPPVTDKAQSQPKAVNKGAKPPLAPVDANLTTVPPPSVLEAGKPPLAPVDVAPVTPPPAEPAPSKPAPSEPVPGQPPGE